MKRSDTAGVSGLQYGPESTYCTTHGRYDYVLVSGASPSSCPFPVLTAAYRALPEPGLRFDAVNRWDSGARLCNETLSAGSSVRNPWLSGSRRASRQANRRNVRAAPYPTPPPPEDLPWVDARNRFIALRIFRCFPSSRAFGTNKARPLLDAVRARVGTQFERAYRSPSTGGDGPLSGRFFTKVMRACDPQRDTQRIDIYRYVV